MLTIYKASAGSGKTYTLAYEYIKALLGVKAEGKDSYTLNSARYSPSGHRQRCRHRGILAITFTNKATEEMKARIVSKLNSLAKDGPEADYADRLTALMGCTQAELAEEAGAALRDMLHDYRHFNVSTIDSFFQMVLRTFAREVDHQGDYEVELNDRYAVASGVGMLFDELNFGEAPREAQIKNWIASYMRERIARGQSFNVFDRSSRLSGEVVRYVHRMCGEDFKPYAAATQAYLDDPARLRRYRAAIRTARADIAEAMRAAAIAALEGLDAEPGGRAIGKSALVGMLETAAKGVMPDASKFAVGDPEKAKTFKAILREGGDDKDVYTVSKLPKIKRQTVFPASTLTALLRGAARAMQEAFVRDSVLQMLADATASLEFLGLAWKYVADFRRENNLVLMSDTNDLLRRIINGAEVPFIYERIGMELHTFLIDEFQDTSVMQWANLRPLVANSIDEADSLIIGDEKQAIYRFRNSDSSLLHHRVANDDFPGRHRERGSAPADNTNHRSAHGVVRFNNALFTRLAAQYGVEGYENVRQSLFGKLDGLGAYVCVRPMTSLTAGTADENARPSSAELRDASVDAMAAEVVREHEAGYAWSRIAVLVRRRADAREVVDALMRRHPEIPLLSNEGLRLDSSAAVRMIVSVLKFVDRSYTTDAPADADEQRYASYGDILLMLSRFEYELGRGDCTPGQALDRAVDGSGGEELRSEATGVRSAKAANLPALVEVIISRNVPEEQRAREFAYISAFQDVVLDYCAAYNPSVHAFLAWWEQNGAKQTVGAAATLDAVTVMTVHKAKGLEWDCVHIPFANWEIEPRSEDVWLETATVAVGDPDDRPPVLALPLSRLWTAAGSPFAGKYAENATLQVADNLNMTYVAFTRPRRELHVHYDPSRGVGKLLQPALMSAHPSDATPEGMPLPEGAEGAGGTFVYGEPTVPEEESPVESDGDVCPTPRYTVCFRDDTRELTTIDDLTTHDPDLGIGNEEQKLDDVPAITHSPEEHARALAAARGNNLHNILARMTVAADLPRAVAATALREGLDEAVQAEYTATLRHAFDEAGDLAGRWFRPGLKVLTEQTIYVGERGESFRPDRIVFYPDGSIDIVDYKFTSEPRDEHRTQVKGYLAMLRAMGHTVLRGYLWYPELRLVLPVS
ncbi:MAG: UvrD-helicase domain-containing protein [Muribaculaceae bacterium]|nr:UvrD-helicase domain-containing protein [Muribaculaceae bacterium]